MQFIKGTRDSLLRPLQIVSGIVERRHTMPILANVLLRKDGEKVSFIATDTELQITTHANIGVGPEAFGTTLSARKTLDILKALPESGNVAVSIKDKKATIQAAKSRFSVQMLPAEDFPVVSPVTGVTHSVTISQKALKRLMHMVHFAMAQNDIRYYLNGMLLELDGSSIAVVATDGHRLALCKAETGTDIGAKASVIIPRKTVIELQRLLEESDADVRMEFAPGQAKFVFGDIELVSKLVEGKFPDYTRVIPKGYSNDFAVDRDTLLRALQRAAIMTSEKFKGVKCNIQPGLFRITSSNADAEEAVEEVEIDYGGASVEVGMNVTYLIELLGNLKCEQVKVELGTAENSSLLLSVAGADDFKYVVMPMRI
jgi:DNA polymerase-3 subunit beta